MHMHTHIHMHINIHTYLNTYMPTDMYTCTYTNMHPNTCTHVHAITHIYALTYINIHHVELMHRYISATSQSIFSSKNGPFWYYVTLPKIFLMDFIFWICFRLTAKLNRWYKDFPLYSPLYMDSLLS